jgi:hypothetical protein
VTNLLKISGDESGGTTIYKHFLILNVLKCDINKNIMRMFERHKHSPRPNTIILVKFVTLSSSKHSEHDTVTACFVICTALETLSHRKLHSTRWNNRTRSADAFCVRC